MSGPDVRAAWLRGLVLPALLVPVLASASGQPVTTVVALGALALLCATVAVLVAIPAGRPAGLTGVRLRAWSRAQGEIRRAEQPDRAGRPRPRAPGGLAAAPGR